MRGVEALSAINSTSTAAVIAEQLRESIIDGAFAPGDQVNEALVAKRLDVSRGPVREALQRLVQEGLLLARPNRGVFVQELEEHDVAEVSAARAVIEHAAGAIITSRDDEHRERTAATLSAIVDRMRAAADEHDWPRLDRIDLDFHIAFVADAGNRRLSRAYATLATEALICRTHFPDPRPARSDVVTLHRELIELVRSGAAGALSRALHEHLSIDEHGSHRHDLAPSSRSRGAATSQA